MERTSRVDRSCSNDYVLFVLIGLICLQID